MNQQESTNSSTRFRVQKIAAFSDGASGGNPAGVVLVDKLPDTQTMQEIAAEVGFSETVFAEPALAESVLTEQKGKNWRVRYFSPESEVPFCGHATIALGAALALQSGNGVFSLILNQATITVEGRTDAGVIWAALQSPPTRSKAAPAELVSATLKLFGYCENDLDMRIAPALIHGGADHLVLALSDRKTLSAMSYDLNAGRKLMTEAGLVTIILVYSESANLFHTRNPFASGGVYEDPATGASTAAFAGYLRDLNWPHGGAIDIIQGEDMQMRSRLHAEIPDQSGSSIRISGTARIMNEE